MSGTRRAFSLLELLAVLLILGLLSGLVVPAVSTASARDREREAMAKLARILSFERIEALRTMQPRLVKLSFEDENAITLSRVRDGEPAARPWAAGVLTPARTERREGAEAWEIVFRPSGRTSTLTLDFRATQNPDRIWRVEFDPVSGAPGVRLGREAES